MTEIQISGQNLTIDGTTIELPKEVQSYVEISGLVVVLLQTEGRSPATNNVWAFTVNGQRKWTAEPVQAASDDANTYVQIKIEDDTLWAADWKGLEYQLNLETGEHIDTKYRK